MLTSFHVCSNLFVKEVRFVGEDIDKRLFTDRCGSRSATKLEAVDLGGDILFRTVTFELLKLLLSMTLGFATATPSLSLADFAPPSKGAEAILDNVFFVTAILFKMGSSSVIKDFSTLPLDNVLTITYRFFFCAGSSSCALFSVNDTLLSCVFSEGRFS